MKVLIAYASTQGQTRKVARHLADRCFLAGHSVELVNLSDAKDTDILRYDRVILAASVHVGHYQKDLPEFAAARASDLAKVPTMLVSVSLAAAGHKTEDWKALDRIAADLAEATGWTPDSTVQVAGAYMPSKYDLFTGFVMRRIVAKKDPLADLDADREYTDWAALNDVFDDWMTRTKRQ